MMLDGFALEGVTQIAVDSIFMMPHLGALAAMHPLAAQEVFEHDCLVNIGHAIVPVWSSGGSGAGGEVAQVFLDGRAVAAVRRSDVKCVPLERGRVYRLRVEARNGAVDLGRGAGKAWEGEIEGGCVGLILDGRNRPIEMPSAGAAHAFQADLFRGVGLL